MNGSLFGQVEAGAAAAGGAAIAVASSVGQLTYDALLDGARGVATALAELGIGRGDRVGVWMEKSPATVQVLLGILASGAAYVAMDPKSPAARCQLISKDAQLSALFVDAPRAQAAHEVASMSPGCRVIADGVPGAHSLTQALALGPTPLPAIGTEDAAYILYTSGSTGTPKGVLHTHGSGWAFVDWVRRLIGPTAADVFSSHAPFHFDLSISDLYAPLTTGGRVQLICGVEAMLSPWLVRKAQEWGVTVWYSVPSVLVGMLDQGGLEQQALPSLRALFFAGEVFPTPQLRRLRAALPHVRLYNLYGPTETNVCTFYEVPAALGQGDAPIPIGGACDHMETFAVTDDGRSAAVGEEGALWARGPNLMRGYFRADGTTGVGLAPDPRGVPGPAYDTGDRVRVRADGGYDFLGRRDHQIKARGYRIELGEVETAALSHPNVLEAVAWAVPDARAGNKLAVTVVSRAGAQVDALAVRGAVSARLPAYMVPEIVDVRSALPRTSTGKADRKALVAEWEGMDEH